MTSSFSKSSVFKLLSLHTKPAFPNFSGLKRVFEKLRFRDGLVRTVGLIVAHVQNRWGRHGTHKTFSLERRLSTSPMTGNIGTGWNEWFPKFPIGNSFSEM